MSARMIFKSPRDNNSKSSADKRENPNNSPMLPYPRINTTKMIIHNYQNVNEGDETQSSSNATNDTNFKSPAINITEQKDDKNTFLEPLPRVTITKSANLFNQLNETSEFNIISSLNKIAKKTEPVPPQVEEKGFTRFSMNNVTNIYINYNFEKKKNTLSVKRTRQEHTNVPIQINTKIYNIQDVRIMRKKIKQYFPELDEYNIEIIEPIYANKFAMLNNKKYLKFKSKRHGDDDKVDLKEDTIEDRENIIHEIEHDHLIIQRKICLDELRMLILAIQENFMVEHDKAKCRDLISRAVYYIEEINRITDRLKKSTLNVVPQVKKPKIKNKKGFQCDYCECEFSNGQALGGHMSRTHPNQSMKYNKKKMIRQEREDKRDLIYQARKELFSNHNLDYGELAKTKDNKSIIRKIRKENMREYKEILDRLKKKY
jgi:hypothetical protein